MTLTTPPTVKSLQEYAYEAIAQHLKKTLKWEKAVKKDEDAEALHQMRVGMRRLRTAISRFDVLLNLPPAASAAKVGKIARRLGELRDIDVLKETLETRYQPNLPAKEQKVLQTAFHALNKQRQKALSHTQVTLKGQSYKSLKQSLTDWLDNPIYQPLASLPIAQVLPDLLLPEISNFFLHPGWLVGTTVSDSEVKISPNLEPEDIEKQFQTQGESIHDLRKQAKRVRYQMELFKELYCEDYAAYVAEVKSIQEILGNMQDSLVMGEWLADIFKSEMDAQLPTLASLLKANRDQLWQEWQPLQERYLQTEHRHKLRLIILNPLVNFSVDETS